MVSVSALDPTVAALQFEFPSRNESKNFRGELCPPISTNSCSCCAVSSLVADAFTRVKILVHRQELCFAGILVPPSLLNTSGLKDCSRKFPCACVLHDHNHSFHPLTISNAYFGKILEVNPVEVPVLAS